jgi:predicted transposase YdaD
VEVEETTEELQHRHRRAATAHTKERLQMLYSIKTGKDLIRQFFREEIMRECVIYQDILQQGLQQGRQEGRQEGEVNLISRQLSLFCHSRKITLEAKL